MDQLRATIEEFAACGYTHVEFHCPPMLRDQVEANQLASTHITGPQHRTAFKAAPLC
jgi:hypothetical protein